MPRRKKNPQPPPTSPIDSCKHCQRSHLKLSKCSKCKEVFYCSADCQQKDWIRHKKVCKPEETKQQVPVPPLPIEEESCNNCGKSGVKLSICSRCHGAKYCSKECQKAEWSKHKVDCKKNSLPTSCTPAKSQRKCRDCSNICTEGSEFCDSCRLKERFANMYSKRQKCHDCLNVSNDNSAYCAKCIKSKFLKLPTFISYSQNTCVGCPYMAMVDSVYCVNCLRSKYYETFSCFTVKLVLCRDCSLICENYCGYCDLCLLKKTYRNMLFPLKVPDNVCQIAKSRYPKFQLITDFDDINPVDCPSPNEQVLLALMHEDGGHMFLPSMILRDDKDQKLRLIFYLIDENLDPKEWPEFEIGSFICIKFPKIHHFLDTTVGFRIELIHLVSFIERSETC